MTGRPFRFVICFLFIFSGLLNAQLINKINIKGNNNIDEIEYQKWCSGFIKSKLSPSSTDSLNKIISKNLILQGYHNFKINNINCSYSSDSSSVDILVNINEGVQTYINNFFITGLDTADTKYVYDNLSFLKETVFIGGEIENVFSELLNYFENNGHPFSLIKIESVNVFYDSLDEKYLADLYLFIDKQQKSIIDSVEIAGNTKTKDYVILRTLRFSENEQYSQAKLEEIPKRLNRLRYFEPVLLPEFYFDKNNTGILKITVKELETNNFDGVIGYVPASGDKEKGYVTGFINVNLRNIFGSGRSAAIKWQQINRYSQEFDLKYLEPWLFNYPFNITFGLYQKKQDTTYVQRNYEANIEYMASEDISASVIISSLSTIPTENLYSKFSVYNSTSLQTGVSFTVDTRDDYYTPRSGFYFTSVYKFSTKKINGPIKYLTGDTKTKIELQKYEFDFSMFYEIFNRQVLMLGLHAREMRGDLFEVSDLYELGGTNTLRGYREKQFVGNRMFWSNFEFRSLLTRRSYAFIFLDSGYYLRNEDLLNNIIKQDGFKIGYGFGLSLETGLGMLKVSYAIAQGQTFNQGLIHFGIANEF